LGIIKQPGVSNSRGKCRVRFQLDGKTYTETYSDLKYASQADINEAARRLQKRKQATSIGSEGSPTGTFGTAAQRWLDTATIAPSHRATAKNRLNRWWIPPLGDKELDSVRPKDLRLVLAQTKHLAPKTRRNVLSDVSAVFQCALADGLIETNPARSVVLPRSKGKAKPDPYTPEERDAILCELSGVADAKAGKLSVTKQIVAGQLRKVTKTYEVREVPIVAPLRAALGAEPTPIRDGPLIVNQYGRRYTSADKLNKPFLEALKRLGIRYRNPYNSRL